MEFLYTIDDYDCTVVVTYLEVIKGDGYWAVSEEDSKDKLNIEFEVYGEHGLIEVDENTACEIEDMIAGKV
jgi:hypothetical protein